MTTPHSAWARPPELSSELISLADELSGPQPGSPLNIDGCEAAAEFFEEALRYVRGVRDAGDGPHFDLPVHLGDPKEILPLLDPDQTFTLCSEGSASPDRQVRIVVDRWATRPFAIVGKDDLAGPPWTPVAVVISDLSALRDPALILDICSLCGMWPSPNAALYRGGQLEFTIGFPASSQNLRSTDHRRGRA